MDTATELGTLLRTWRSRVQPEEVGSPFHRAARRTPGLRREEVAWLAGVSPDYVKRLEQGRSHPGPSVLRALGRALRLSEAEYDLACQLAGHSAELGGQVPQLLTPGVRRLLIRLADTPIAVFDAAWTLLEHNEIWTALTGERYVRDDRETNLVWRSFLGNTGRVRHPLAADNRTALVADLRTASARYPKDHELTAMIDQLRSRSVEFTQIWDAGAVGYNVSEHKYFDHPDLGAIELDCDVLTVHGADLRVIVFTAPPGSEAEGKLELLRVVGASSAAPTTT